MHRLGDDRAGTLASSLALARPFARAFSQAALQPAMVRAVPLYLMLLVVGSFLFQAVPLHRALGAAPRLLPAAALLWVILLTPVRGPLFGARQTEYLRSLPVPTGLLRVTIVMALLVIDGPWVALCLASGNWSVMVGGPVLTGAAHAALGSRRWSCWLALAGLLALAALVPLPFLVLPALVLAAWAGPWAWTVTRTGRVAPGARLHLQVPWIGLGRALGTAVLLAERQLLRRALLVLALLTGIAALAVRNNQLRELEVVLRVCLAVLVVGLPFAYRLTVGVIEKGWALGWLCDATGAGRWTRALSGLTVVLMSGAAMGALHGALVASLTRWPRPLVLVLVETGVGAALATVALGVTAASVRGRLLDPSLVQGYLVLLAVLFSILVGSSLRVGFLALVPLLAAAPFAYVRRVAARPVT